MIPISLIDPNPGRRAWFVRSLAQLGRHIEPYENVSELIGGVRSEGVYLVCDTGGLVQQVIAAIRASENPVAVIAYSEVPTPRSVVGAIRAGAIDYLVGLGSDLNELIEVVQLAELSIERERPHIERLAKVRKCAQTLTVRERQVLELLAVGSTNRAMGDRLGISSRTVEIHRANMLAKLGAINAPEAVRYAVEVGLVR